MWADTFNCEELELCGAHQCDSVLYYETAQNPVSATEYPGELVSTGSTGR